MPTTQCPQLGDALPLSTSLQPPSSSHFRNHDGLASFPVPSVPSPRVQASLLELELRSPTQQPHPCFVASPFYGKAVLPLSPDRPHCFPVRLLYKSPVCPGRPSTHVNTSPTRAGWPPAQVPPSSFPTHVLCSGRMFLPEAAILPPEYRLSLA